MAIKLRGTGIAVHSLIVRVSVARTATQCPCARASRSRFSFGSICTAQSPRRTGPTREGAGPAARCLRARPCGVRRQRPHVRSAIPLQRQLPSTSGARLTARRPVHGLRHCCPGPPGASCLDRHTAQSATSTLRPAHIQAGAIGLASVGQQTAHALPAAYPVAFLRRLEVHAFASELVGAVRAAAGARKDGVVRYPAGLDWICQRRHMALIASDSTGTVQPKPSFNPSSLRFVADGGLANQAKPASPSVRLAAGPSA